MWYPFEMSDAYFVNYSEYCLMVRLSAIAFLLQIRAYEVVPALLMSCSAHNL